MSRTHETLFVSDIHLDATRPRIIDLFNRFLVKRACYADALYILGDLFEYWIGDDAAYPEYQATFTALKKISERQAPVFFLHGNRDFLVAKKFSQLTGARLLPEEHRAQVYGQNILLMHGDTLCTDDIAYQKFRQKAHNKLLQWIVLHLPLSLRQSLAARLRETSRQATADKSAEIMDVNQMAVAQAMQRHGVTTLIHGHTHRPAIHEFELNRMRCQRAVLGDWYQQASVLSMTQEGFRLESFASLE